MGISTLVVIQYRCHMSRHASRVGKALYTISTLFSFHIFSFFIFIFCRDSCKNRRTILRREGEEWRFWRALKNCWRFNVSARRRTQRLGQRVFDRDHRTRGGRSAAYHCMLRVDEAKNSFSCFCAVFVLLLSFFFFGFGEVGHKFF